MELLWIEKLKKEAENRGWAWGSFLPHLEFLCIFFFFLPISLLVLLSSVTSLNLPSSPFDPILWFSYRSEYIVFGLIRVCHHISVTFSYPASYHPFPSDLCPHRPHIVCIIILSFSNCHLIFLSLPIHHLSLSYVAHPFLCIICHYLSAASSL